MPYVSIIGAPHIRRPINGGSGGPVIDGIRSRLINERPRQAKKLTAYRFASPIVLPVITPGVDARDI
ncbi:hypothetical protein CHELA41_24494 [Hyphomicrobiales bacterium]|nr:hypothetical protein CHELA41_24494 [Hyphomicrobiales bacterium]